MNGFDQPSALSRCVFEIVQAQPAGLKHADIVRAVRASGFDPKVKNLSALVHGILTDLVTGGIISRHEDDYLERRYSTKKIDVKRADPLHVDPFCCIG